MHTATGFYRLDPVSMEFFGARGFRLLQRDLIVLGRYGRRGSIRGSLSGRRLLATWRESDRSGYLTLEFDSTYSGFEGVFGSAGSDSESVRAITASRVRRSSVTGLRSAPATE